MDPPVKPVLSDAAGGVEGPEGDAVFRGGG